MSPSREEVRDLVHRAADAMLRTPDAVELVALTNWSRDCTLALAIAAIQAVLPTTAAPLEGCEVEGGDLSWPLVMQGP